MNITEIASAIGGTLRGRTDISIEHLLTDSRELHNTPTETLFFGIRTEKRDGAQFCQRLYEQGVRAFVVSSGSEYTSLSWTDAAVIIVDNTIEALQRLAAYKRSLFPNLTVIGITGSNGKTAVKEWLYNLLRDDYNICRSPRSYNSQIGVPLSVWQLNAEHNLAIFEAGISEVGEMEKLERIIRPTIGVVTYIGAEHGENFLSMEQKRAEKMLLFKHCATIIEDPTHQNIRTCAAVLRCLGYGEEQISRMLMEKTHQTVMQIDLDALSSNVRYFRSLIGEQTKLVCMVKAFAYGAGHVEVSQRLQTDGIADYLAVAVADEAAELRAAGIRLPIIVMDPEPTALETIIHNYAEPNIYNFDSLLRFAQVAEQEGQENYPIHIKIDSGMHRLGFDPTDMPQLVSMLQRLGSVKVSSVFSHLAGADEEQFDDFTLSQINAFRSAANALQEGLGYPVTKHILNSAGIERFTDYKMDMCRLGIGMYGFSAAGHKLQNVCTLKSTLLSVKTIMAGESIGYGRHTYLNEPRQIGVIPIGYADGFDRRFGNYGAEVLINGTRCPVVGNVCMDLAMIDVTDAHAKEGDEVIIFSDKLPIEELAQKLGTITYEILTSVSRRVKRVYV